MAFDGSNWRIYTLPNETKIFSVAIGKDERIYVGSQNEIGYFAPGKAGRLEYSSLTELIPKSKLDFAEKIQYLHQLEIERTESEIIRLKNEKLENEIQHKNFELASTAMNMVYKGEILTKIKGEVIRLKKTAGTQQTEEGYKNIIRMLDENKTKRDWDMFAQHFDKIYSDFLTALKEHYPNLTAGDAKLCAYLRLNLTCKEISQLSNITVKSVELSRHRLRKKLQLAPEVNLANFLSSFHSEYKKREHEQ